MNDTQPRSGITWTMSPESRSPGPVQDGAAGEVAAAADQRQVLAEVVGLARPVLDHRVVAHHPLAVGLVQQHRALEAVRPFDHRRVVVRVRDRDRGEPAAAVDLRRGRVVEQRDAVPQHVALAVRDEQRALADREARLTCRSRSARPRAGSRCGGRRAAPRRSSTAGRRSGTHWRASSHTGQSSAGPPNWTPQVTQIGSATPEILSNTLPPVSFPSRRGTSRAR